MAHALVCDCCEAIGRGPSARGPDGWVVLRIETVDVEHRTLHCCSGGCAVRALAQYVHEREQLIDERDRCEVAGCERPIEPATLRCAEHAHSTRTAWERCDEWCTPPAGGPAQRCELPDEHDGLHRANSGQLDEYVWDSDDVALTTGG